MTKTHHYLIASFILLCLNLIFISNTYALHSESNASCDENVISEPVAMLYSQHTDNCVIGPVATDLDRFSFNGNANDVVRININTITNGLGLSLEVRDPNGMIIIDGDADGAACNSVFTCSFSIDIPLPLTGSYFLALSEIGLNNTGGYTMTIEKLDPAELTPRIDYDSAMLDTLTPSTDVDNFSFYGTPGTQIRFNISSTTNGIGPTIEIRDPNGNVVKNGAVDGASCNSVFTCSFVVNLSPATAGFYSLIIYDLGLNNTGDYQISLWCLVGLCDSNGDLIPDLPAPVITYDTPVVDTITPAVDGDFFTFDATAGTDIRFNVNSTTNGMGPVIEVRDPSGNTIINGAIDGAACTSVFTCSFIVDYAVTLSGSYSVIIYDSGANNTGNYQLNLLCLSGPCDNIPNPAGPRLSFVTSLSETLSPAVDADLYTFNASVGTEIQFNVTSTTNGIGPQFEIRDPDGLVIINGAADGAGCDSVFTCAFSVDLIPAVSGTYSLLIYDSGINNTGDYQIGMWCMSGNCDSDADGIFDGDRQIIDYGESVADKTITPFVDADFYIFNGTTGDDIRINVQSTTNGLGPTIIIRDPNNNIIVNGAADGASCNSVFTCSFFINLTIPVNGTYSLMIFDTGTNNSGNYALGLQCLFGSCNNLTTPLVCGDNCVDTPNPLQTDSDADGYGNSCDADLDNNGIVNFVDLNRFRSCFGTQDPACDLDDNGFINFADLNKLKQSFGTTPGPACSFPNQP